MLKKWFMVTWITQEISKSEETGELVTSNTYATEYLSLQTLQLAIRDELRAVHFLREIHVTEVPNKSKDSDKRFLDELTRAATAKPAPAPAAARSKANG